MKIKHLTSDEIVTLIAFYQTFPQWRLITKIIELETEDEINKILKNAFDIK